MPLRLLASGVLCLLLALPTVQAQAPRRATPSPVAVSVRARLARPLVRADSLDRAGATGLSVQGDVWPERRLGALIRLDLERYGLRTPGAPEVLGNAGRVLERADAVNRWDWAHWKRSYNNSNGVRGLDDNFDARLTPEEGASVLTFSAAPVARLHGRRVRLAASAGVAGSLSRRTLALREQWARTFPTVEGGYVYRYEFMNDAPDKTGYGVGLDAGLDAQLRLSRLVRLVGGVRLRHYVLRRAFTDTGLDNVRLADEKALPFNDVLGVELGISLW